MRGSLQPGEGERLLLLARLKKRWSGEKVLVLNARKKKEQMEVLVFFIQSIQGKMNNKIKCIFSII